MAEALLKKILKDTGKSHITVRSAGVAALGGLPPTLETMEVLKNEGIDVSGSRSKKVTADMLNGSDLILVMEELHREEILRIAPWVAPKLSLLKDYGLSEKKPANPGVADPIGRPKKDYEAAFEAIKKEIKRIAEIL
jgi:protein-tyrosine-phosphatase